MLIKEFEKCEKIQFNKDEKFCKYSMIKKNKVVKFSRGRALELYLRNSYGYAELELDNIPHWEAGDININNIEYNIKSKNCELNAEGITIQEKIENYIAQDASEGLIYLIEHKEKFLEIRMTWEEAREFIATFGKLDRGAIRIKNGDRTIYNWAIEKIA